jgi:hypothetical protein
LPEAAASGNDSYRLPEVRDTKRLEVSEWDERGLCGETEQFVELAHGHGVLPRLELAAQGTDVVEVGLDSLGPRQLERLASQAARL